MNDSQTASELNDLLDPVIELSRDAGRRIVEIYENEFTVEHKDDKSPLTEADMAAHNAISAGLGVLSAELPVLSEESAEIPFDQRRQWDRYWLVDPLDGTREFIKRNGEFTVNIALIEGHQAILGVVHVPVSGVTYFAARGHGAFRQDGDSVPVPIHVRRYEGGRVTVAGSRSHRGDSLNRFLSNLPDYEIISMGSALKSCLVAEGKADIYPRLGPTSEWDTGAAQCIVEEAGGRVTDLEMRPLLYNTKESLLNPHFFAFGAGDTDWANYL
ncbi:MAG TPA: 3'(2'),5'-bisphosphate nucleotidase CysQ [Gammaproteobacteria bacterium]|nr:3'(2'),5'-bisphosphate nucleotidase CysQ [Gammaproteobacteria bacterium]